MRTANAAAPTEMDRMSLPTAVDDLFLADPHLHRPAKERAKRRGQDHKP
jgi:hypothetical protein